jgi:UDPglucose 6-dehydrogenase
MRPDRVIIGVESDTARDVMKKVYRPLYLIETPIVLTSLETAELIKYASNTFLATKISFINEMAAIAEAVGADIDDVARGMGLDGRIGRKFLHAGVGFGGSCLPKDVSSLVHLAGTKGYDAALVRAVLDLNAKLPDSAVDKLVKHTTGVKGKVIAVLGLSFKPNTDDIREAASIRIVERLIGEGATVRAYDPVAMDRFSELTKLEIMRCKDPYDAAEGADGLILVTEWNEFRQLDLDRLATAMKTPVFVDCRNVYKPAAMEARGFKYESFGRGKTGA